MASCRFAVLFWLTPVLLGACTPEAIVVDPSGGNGGQEPSGGKASSGGKSSGGNDSAGVGADTGGGGGGQSNAPQCAPLTSPRGGCITCLQEQCADEVAACADNACACGEWGDATGQMSCMLACLATGAKPESCTAGCGFANIPDAHPATRGLIDCLMVPPSGPPSCEPCLPPR